MAESVFSTPRNQTKTADQMLESMIQKRNIQKQNMAAITEASKLEASTPDFTAILESSNLETEQNIARNAAMEGAYYKNGSKNIAMAQLGMKQRLIQEGMSYVKGQVLGELIYECYWLDDPVKAATIDQIGDNINSVMGYIEENFGESKVAESKQSKLLKEMNTVIETVVKEAAERICKECEETDGAFPDFNLTDAEEEELDNKLVDLGRDEIIELIKDKVAAVVQDEKQKGIERAEMFDNIEKAVSNEPDEGNDEEPTETEEAMLAGIRSGEITLEGATWDTLKVIFSDDKKKAKAAYNNAARLVRRGQYDEAAKEYENAKNIFKEMLLDVKSTDESAISSVCSFMLSGWLEHAFIASIGGPSATVSITRAVCVTLSSMFGLMIPFSLVMQMQTNQDNVKKDRSNHSTNDYKVYTIEALELNIKTCDAMIKECKSKSRGGNHTLEGAFAEVATGSGYTANERHIASLMESGAPIALFDDPTWGEFKAYVSMTSKRIKELLDKAGMSGGEQFKGIYATAKGLIEDFEDKLSGVPENIPGDVKTFVMAMVNIIYTAVPADEVIISKFGNPLGSPDLGSNNPAVDMATVSWTDLFVNIKTNLSSIKGYCDNKISHETIDDTDLNNSECPVTGKNSLAQKVAQQQSRIIARNMGGSLFEAMMIGALGTISKEAMESSSNVSDDDVEDAALIETLLNYTVFETLDTLGIYKFRMADYNEAKRHFMKPTMEADDTTGIGSDGSSAITQGTDNSGKKLVRINTSKMKRKTANSMKSNLPTPDTSDN